MNAVATEYRAARVWKSPEPDGPGHDKLMTWALYRRDGGSVGRPRAAGIGWDEPLDRAVDAEPAWVVLVDHALVSIYRVHSVYERMVKIFYLDRRAVWEVAEKVQRTPGFVLLSLRGICDHVETRVNS